MVSYTVRLTEKYSNKNRNIVVILLLLLVIVVVIVVIMFIAVVTVIVLDIVSENGRLLFEEFGQACHSMVTI